MWIVVNAIWIFNMTERHGHFAVLRRSFGRSQRRPAHAGDAHRLLLRRPAGGAGRIRHARRDQLGDAPRAGLPADRPPPSLWSPTPRPWPSARSRSRSSTLAPLTDLPMDELAPWSAARRRFLALFVPLILVAWSTGAAASRPVARRDRRRRRLRDRPVRVLELPLGRADRHRRLAARRRRDRRPPPVLAARRPRRRAAPAPRPAMAGARARDAAGGGRAGSAARRRFARRRLGWPTRRT